MLTTENLARSFGGVFAVDNVTMSVSQGELRGIIGPNGAGRSTLFNLIAGHLAPSHGRITYRGRSLAGVAPHRRAREGIAIVFQGARLFRGMTALENVMVGAHARTRHGFASAALRLPAHRREERLITERAEAALERVGLTDFTDVPAESLPLGQQRRLQVARALCGEPALRLDEPASGLRQGAIHGRPTLLGLAGAPIVAGLLGLLVGVPLLRMRGHYLAFATLAFQLILLAVIGQESWLGGDIGLSGIPALGIGSQEITGYRGYAWAAWLALLVVMLLTRNVVRSRPGRGLRALATSEMAAASSGVPVGRYKLAVFGLSAAFAGLADGIFAFFMAYLAPGSFGVLLSIQFVVMAVVGGLGTVWGPLVGASSITLLVHWLNDFGSQPGMPAHAPQVFSYAIYALLLVLAVLFLPRGLVPVGADALRLLTRRFARERPDAEAREEPVPVPQGPRA
ncbi:ATP-binding cassette domain-containing protein [Streptomyces sp. T028]|uniref:ATP-binding cassette domain-containing protein n=1 Tax=Streptomyces sp. T028 TaxID=3394379 RepID=UPI003A87CE02